MADALAPEDLPRALETTRRQLAGESPGAYELTILTKDRRRVLLEVNTRLMYDGETPVGVQGIGRDITARKRAEQQTAALLSVAGDISGTLDLGELIEKVQRRTAEVLACDRVATYLFDSENDALRLVSQYGTPPDLLASAKALTFGRDQLVHEAIEAGQSIVINDMADQPWLPAEVVRHFALSRLVVVPLRLRDRNLGALVAANTGDGPPFNSERTALIEGIARQLAVAIESAELFRAEREETAVAAALARVGRELIAVPSTPRLLDHLCQLSTEVLGCDCSITLLWQLQDDVWVPLSAYGLSSEEWEAIRAMRLPRGLFSNVLAALEQTDTVQVRFDQSLRTEVSPLAVRLGVTVALYTALRRGDELVGCQVAYFRGVPHRFSAQQQRIAQGIAQLASLALENARLVERLEQADRLKSEFVATMSHELRTPLNIILGYNELLLEGIFGSLNSEQHDSLQRIHKNTLELLELINATLDLSRLAAGRMPLEQQLISVFALASELDRDTADLRNKPDVAFTWDLAPELPPLHTDAAKLKVVIKNLIVNALKFTQHGHVTVSAQSRDGGVEIAVADSGIGIPAPALAIIFEPFRQVDSSATRRYGGVGLGLHIARRLVELLGGHISVESEVNRGSTFRVWIPIRAQLAQAAA
ncbi:MAG TPA: ATP-binding protein [Candidatus Kryptonia bacterium]|nr:ATP-binding protein [Candidatus Kryptonia bacterium]